MSDPNDKGLPCFGFFVIFQYNLVSISFTFIEGSKVGELAFTIFIVGDLLEFEVGNIRYNCSNERIDAINGCII